MRPPQRGLFITFEGVDGAGKTTQRDHLVARLREHGNEVVSTREPGGTRLGGVIRELLLHYSGAMDVRAESLLYAADRAQHVFEVVEPALAAGRLVVQDRYIDSSVAYQGSGRVLDPADVRGLSEWAARELCPDLTVLLDLDRVVAKQRLETDGGSLDRLESEKDEFHERVRQSFLAMARAFPDRFFVVDASLPSDVIAGKIHDRVKVLLDSHDGFVSGPR